MPTSSLNRVWLLSSVAVVVAASVTLAPAATHAASPGPAACQEYSVCGGPTAPGARPRAAKSGPGHRGDADVAGWIRLPLVGYPITPAIAALAAVLLAAVVALGLGTRVRARPRAT